MLKNIKIDKRDFIPVLILFQNSLFLYLAIFFHSIGPLSWLRYTLFPILMVIATIISFDGIKKIHLYDYFYIGIVASIFIVHYFAFKENLVTYMVFVVYIYIWPISIWFNSKRRKISLQNFVLYFCCYIADMYCLFISNNVNWTKRQIYR